jgi:hypothetical protein
MSALIFANISGDWKINILFPIVIITLVYVIIAVELKIIFFPLKKGREGETSCKTGVCRCPVQSGWIRKDN